MALIQPCSLIIAFARITKISGEKSTKLWPDKFVDGFWTYNCSMRSKMTETSIVFLIAHDDLEEFFPGSELVTIHGKFLAI